MNTTNVIPIFWGFWNPQNHGDEELFVKIIENEKKKQHSKKPPCKIMIALQRSLSEAQKRNYVIAIKAIKYLIQRHKYQCKRCRPLGG